jgi:hypothetical protein
MVLNFPHLIEAQLVGQDDLLQRLLIDPVLVYGSPGPHHRMLVEDSEFHDFPPRYPDVFKNLYEMTRFGLYCM